MHVLNKAVVPKVLAEWEGIPYELQYEILGVKNIRSKHKENPKEIL